MTDLERAADALADARAERDAYMRSYEEACRERDRARREGAEEMRERAAQTAMDHEAPTTARAILDLPLTPEEPA